MNLAPIFRNGACALALAVGAGLFAPAGAQEAPLPEGQESPLEVVPEEPGTPPEEALPPEILPAPDIPIEDPVVELPPPGEVTPPAAGIVPPGVPLTPQGAVFSFADLAEQLLDSVVYISTAQRVTLGAPTPLPDVPQPPDEDFFEEFFDQDRNRGGRQPRMVQSLGSGFVIDPSGLIVTNNHVISEADEIEANFRDGRKLKAEVIGIDDKTDLALIKVEPPTPLAAARFGRSESLRVG